MYSNKENVNILTALLAAYGVRHAVVCPGSRNAPIVHNLNECPGIECHPVTDERSAAFCAIGISLATGMSPVAVCVTSGSALLNVAPAVAEAFYRHIPLIVISADRPAQWIGQLDGQTLKALCRIYETRQSIDYSLMRPYPSMLFGMETAERNFEQGGSVIFDTPFTRGEEGIPINGLVWMGSLQEMMSRLEEKMQAGFACVKLKIGAIDFDDEMRLIRHIRNRFGKEYIELRVDANGGFSPAEAPQRLEQLAAYDIHSIEQPIRQRQWTEMARLCRESPLPIALDEELIGVNSKEMKTQMLDFIRPQYIILKPSLHGGMHGTREWKELADKRGIGSWITSALESNVGLNAVAQLAASVYGPGITMPQGLGTGLLFTDNLPMPLEIRKDRLWRVP